MPEGFDAVVMVEDLHAPSSHEAEIVKAVKALGLKESGESAYAVLRENRGRLLKWPSKGEPSVSSSACSKVRMVREYSSENQSARYSIAGST